MKWIRWLAVAAVASLVGAGGRLGPAWAAEQGPIKVGCIFSITGPASNLGAPEKKTVEMLVERINASGGVLGRPIELIMKDSEGSPEKATSFAHQLIEEEGVLAILGPSISGESLAIKNICQENKTVLLSCAAAEKITEPPEPYVFKTAPTDAYAAQWILETMKQLAIRRVGVLVSNDGFGLAGRDQLVKYAPKYGVEIAASEVYDKAATDLTGALNKLKGENVQAVVNWSIVPAQALVAKNMKQLDFDVPLFQSHGFANIRYVQAGGAAANGTIFPAGRLIVADLLPSDNPQKKLLMEYKKEYEARYHEDVSAFGGHAYDALTILVEAIRKAGSTEPQKVRDAIENLRDFPGTAGTFNFSKKDHNGLDPTCFVMLTVKDGKFAFYSTNK